MKTSIVCTFNLVIQRLSKFNIFNRFSKLLNECKLCWLSLTWSHNIIATKHSSSGCITWVHDHTLYYVHVATSNQNIAICQQLARQQDFPVSYVAISYMQLWINCGEFYVVASYHTWCVCMCVCVCLCDGGYVCACMHALGVQLAMSSYLSK